MNDLFASALLALLNGLLPAAVLAFFAWISFRCFPKIPAATRYLVWWMVLAAVILIPLLPAFRAAEPRSEIVTAQIPIQTSRPDTAPRLEPGILNPAPAFRSAASPTDDATTIDAPPQASPVKVPTGSWIWVAAAIVAFWFLYRSAQLIRSYRYLRGIRDRAEPAPTTLALDFDTMRLTHQVTRPMRLLISTEIVSPMAVGFLKPAVLLPAALLDQFEPAELEHALLHEMAHLARYDDWSNLLGRLIGTAFGLHPIAALALHHIERDRESACDDWVVANTGDARPYAASLTRLFELTASHRNATVLSTGMADRKSHLGERIERLLESGRVFHSGASRIVLVTTAAAVLVGAVASTRLPQWIVLAQEPTPQPERPAGPQPTPAPATRPQVPPGQTAAQPAEALPRAVESDREIAEIQKAEEALQLSRMQDAKAAVEALQQELLQSERQTLELERQLDAAKAAMAAAGDQAQVAGATARAQVAAREAELRAEVARLQAELQRVPSQEPAVISRVAPEYSDEALKARYQGVVRLRFRVSAQGNAEAIRVTRSLGLGLDEKAIEAVRQWRFRPAMQNGLPVAADATAEIEFRLRGDVPDISVLANDANSLPVRQILRDSIANAVGQLQDSIERAALELARAQIELAVRGQSLDPQLRELSQELEALRAVLREQRSRYTPDHPAVKDLQQQIERIEREVERQKAEVVARESTADPAAYRIQANDVLHVDVRREESFTRDLTVGSDGTFSLPLIGSVIAAGKSPNQLSSELAKRLADYIQNPDVRVSVIKHN